MTPDPDSPQAGEAAASRLAIRSNLRNALQVIDLYIESGDRDTETMTQTLSSLRRLIAGTLTIIEDSGGSQLIDPLP